MGILKIYKRGFSSLHSDVIITAKQREYYQGEEVEGAVIFRHVPSSESITLELHEFWGEKIIENDELKTVTRVNSEHEMTLNLSDELTQSGGYVYPFKFKLPENCRISSSNSGWNIEIIAEISVNQSLKVLPAREFLAVVSVLEKKMRFKEKKSSRYWRNNGFTTFRLIPPEILEKEIEFMLISFRIEKNGMIAVSSTVKQKEKTVLDYFRYLEDSSNLIKHNFELDPSQIFNSEGIVDSAAVIRIIAPVLEESLKR